MAECMVKGCDRLQAAAVTVPPRAWTDYPIIEMGDTPGKEAPIRECYVVGQDSDKYVRCRVEGHSIKLRAGYLYSAPGRCGEAPQYHFKGADPIEVKVCLMHAWEITEGKTGISFRVKEEEGEG